MTGWSGRLLRANDQRIRGKSYFEECQVLIINLRKVGEEGRKRRGPPPPLAFKRAKGKGDAPIGKRGDDYRKQALGVAEYGT